MQHLYVCIKYTVQEQLNSIYRHLLSDGICMALILDGSLVSGWLQTYLCVQCHIYYINTLPTLPTTLSIATAHNDSAADGEQALMPPAALHAQSVPGTAPVLWVFRAYAAAGLIPVAHVKLLSFSFQRNKTVFQ